MKWVLAMLQIFRFVIYHVFETIWKIVRESGISFKHCIFNLFSSILVANSAYVSTVILHMTFVSVKWLFKILHYQVLKPSFMPENKIDNKSKQHH